MKLKEILNDVASFQLATSQIVNSKPTLSQVFGDDLLRYELMEEENKEYLDACKDEDLVEILDACVDQLYILCGTINQHGLQSVIEEAFNRVHSNNMSKVGIDGKVLRNANGKILKPDGFKAVDLTDLITKK